MEISSIPLPEWILKLYMMVITSVIEHPYDFAAPNETEYRINKSIDNKLITLGEPSIDANELIAGILKLDSGKIMDDIAATIKRTILSAESTISGDPSAECLLRLAGDPRNEEFYLALYAWRSSNVDEELRQKAKICWAELEGRAGERRANATVNYMHAVLEGPYQATLRKMVEFFLLLENSTKFPDPKFGNLNSQAKSKLSCCPEIVDDVASRIRNSQAHLDWNYHPESDSLTVRDGDKFNLELPVDEWLARTSKLHAFADETFTSVYRILLFRAAQHLDIANLLAQWFEAMRCGDKDWFRSILEQVKHAASPISSAHHRLQTLGRAPR